MTSENDRRCNKRQEKDSQACFSLQYGSEPFSHHYDSLNAKSGFRPDTAGKH